MRRKTIGGVIASAIALTVFGAFAFFGNEQSQALVGFYMAAVGGISAALGELAGSGFGGDDGKRGALMRTVGFIGLTLGSLLITLPDANRAVSSSEDLATRYVVACLLVVALVPTAFTVAFFVKRSD